MRERIETPLVIACMLGAAIVFAGWCTGCSAGPQLPVSTTTITVTNNNYDGGTMEDCDILIDRSAAASDALGNDLHGSTISPSVRADVSAVPSP